MLLGLFTDIPDEASWSSSSWRWCGRDFYYHVLYSYFFRIRNIGTHRNWRRVAINRGLLTPELVYATVKRFECPLAVFFLYMYICIKNSHFPVCINYQLAVLITIIYAWEYLHRFLLWHKAGYSNRTMTIDTLTHYCNITILLHFAYMTSTE